MRLATSFDLTFWQDSIKDPWSYCHINLEAMEVFGTCGSNGCVEAASKTRNAACSTSTSTSWSWWPMSSTACSTRSSPSRTSPHQNRSDVIIFFSYRIKSIAFLLRKIRAEVPLPKWLLWWRCASYNPHFGLIWNFFSWSITLTLLKLKSSCSSLAIPP